MSDGSVAAIAAASLIEAHSSAGALPATDQVARFEQQLQLPGAAAEPGLYAAHVTESSVAGVNLQPLVDYAGQLSKDFLSQVHSMSFKTDTTGLSRSQAAALHVMEESCAKACQFGLTTLNFQFYAKGVQDTGESARTLFQQT
jgi:hypothetical protein